MMGKQFEFADFIDEFKVEIKIYDNQVGHYDDDGKWIKGDSIDPVTIIGIVLPAASTFGGSENLNRETDGTYTQKDCKIYTTQPLKVGQKVEYDEQFFIIDSSKDYSAYADVYIYFAKGVK